MMDMKSVESKWQAKWEKTKQNVFKKNSKKEKLYVLEMFSYPSGAKLHVGHWYNYGPTDSFARYKKMKGFEVFQPMGFDAFGLPAENFAISFLADSKSWGLAGCSLGTKITPKSES